jgi:hypothetical protein
MRLVFILILLNLLSGISAARANLISIQTVENRVLFYSSDRNSIERISRSLGCSVTDIRSVEKSILEPNLSHPELRSSVRTPLATLRLFDANSNFFPFGSSLARLVNDMNMVLDRYEFEGLPQRILQADVTACLPPHIVPLLFQESTGETGANCFMSALNFHRQRSLEFTSATQLMEELSRGYRASGRDSQPQPGDIGIMRDSNGSVIHAFVWIGDNWVFTKNGTGNLQPYRFQRFEQMQSYYNTSRVEFFSPNR